METTIAVIFVSVCLLITLLYKCFSGLKKGGHHYPNPDNITRPNSLLRLFGVRHVNAIVDQFKTLDQVTDAVQKAGLESCNLIFGEFIIIIIPYFYRIVSTPSVFKHVHKCTNV